MKQTKKQTLIVGIKTASELFDALGLSEGYLFRGQTDYRWELSTSLERAIAGSDHCMPHPAYFEYWMLHEFKRKYRLYGSSPPPEDDPVEWLAIMQHHGCPTRLLDVTASPYIATYFACVGASTHATVWGFDEYHLRHDAHSRFDLGYEAGDTLHDTINRHHLDCLAKHVGDMKQEGGTPGVLPIAPCTVTERLVRQQGLFLAPVDLAWGNNTFGDNLAASLCHPEEAEASPSELSARVQSASEDRPASFQILIPAHLSTEISSRLLAMNITAEILFPGLDGLAKSMWQHTI